MSIDDAVIQRMSEMVADGKDYLEVSKYIKGLKLEQTEERWYFNRLDRLLVTHEAEKNNKFRISPYKFIGLLLILAGIFMMFYTYNPSTGMAVLPYGLILIGIAGLFM